TAPAGNPRGCIPGIDEESRVLGNPSEIVCGVVRNDYHAVPGRQKPLGQDFALEADVVMPHCRQNGDMRIVVADQSAAALEQLHDLKRGRLARVVDVFLVGDSKQADAASLERFGFLIESLARSLHHIFRHGRINLARQLDEARMDAELTGYPRQVERVNGNTVSAQPRSWIKS